MEHLQNQEQDMKDSLSELEAMKVDFTQFIKNLESQYERYQERVKRIDTIERAGWAYGSTNNLPNLTVKTLIDLREIANDRLKRDEDRLFDSRSIVQKLVKYCDELRFAIRNFSLYNNTNALRAANGDPVDASGVAEVMLESRKLAAQANALIEIEAGKTIHE